MSWGYAAHRFAYAWTLDTEEFNDNLVLFSNEMNGNLNEQNFAETCVVDMMTNANTQPDIMARVFAEKTKTNPNGPTGNMERIPPGTRWNPISRGELLFVSRGGLAWVIFSFQMHCPSIPAKASGMNFALEVDGVVRMDTLLGTGDQSNDFIDLAFGASVGGGEVEYDYGTSPSFRAEHEPKLVKGLFRLEPGGHRIRLVARNLSSGPNNTPQYISQVEAIALDMWA